MTQTQQSLPTPLQEYVHKSRYAKWIPSLQRREHWPETVQRYVDYFENKFPHYPANDIKMENDDLLKLYSLYKQATEGPNKTDKPGFFDVKGRAKWQAWTDKGEMSKEQAQKEYIEMADAWLPAAKKEDTDGA